MTLKEKIGKALVVGGLVGCLGGAGSMFYYNLRAKPPTETLSVSRMNQIEQELRSITGIEMFENQQVLNHYHALEGEYNAFRNKPSAMGEKAKYKLALEDFGRNQRNEAYSLASLFASTILLSIGMAIRDKPTYLWPWRREEKK